MASASTTASTTGVTWPGPVSQLYVPFDSPDAISRGVALLKQEGLAVFTGLIAPDEADRHVDDMAAFMEAVCPQLDMSDPERTWKKEHLPPQTRSGLFQGLFSHAPTAWRLRCHPRVCALFRKLYDELRGRPAGPLITSIDGVNVRPPIKPFCKPTTKDWAHVDQTFNRHKRDAFACIQGQAVLTDTTASFRASPRSHLAHRQLVCKQGQLDEPSNWCKFDASTIADVKAAVERLGGAYQLPIVAPKGSFIVWFSSTTHSARSQTADPCIPIPQPMTATASRTGLGKVKTESTSTTNAVAAPLSRWHNWRAVVYVCHRPLNEMEPRQRKAVVERLQRCVIEGRTTNHWALKMFGKWGRFKGGVATTPGLNKLVNDPRLLFDLPGVKRGNEYNARLASLLQMKYRPTAEQPKLEFGSSASGSAAAAAGGSAATKVSTKKKKKKTSKKEKKSKKRSSSQQESHNLAEMLYGSKKKAVKTKHASA